MNRVKWIFRIGAISNFLVTIGGIVDPVGTWNLVASAQKILPQSWQMWPVPALQPPSFLIIWTGMAFLWGVVMWEISTNPIKHEALIKYTYLEKCVTTYAIAWGVFYHHSMPMIVWLLILYTDVLYILLYIYAHIQVRKQMRSS
jgi:hypothetical protein